MQWNLSFSLLSFPSLPPPLYSLSALSFLSLFLSSSLLPTISPLPSHTTSHSSLSSPPILSSPNLTTNTRSSITKHTFTWDSRIPGFPCTGPPVEDSQFTRGKEWLPKTRLKSTADISQLLCQCLLMVGWGQWWHHYIITSSAWHTMSYIPGPLEGGKFLYYRHASLSRCGFWFQLQHSVTFPGESRNLSWFYCLHWDPASIQTIVVKVLWIGLSKCLCAFSMGPKLLMWSWPTSSVWCWQC